MNLLKLYKNLVVKYPLLIQPLQTATVVSTGDIIAQTVIEKKSFQEYNPKRTFQFFLVGGFFIGPSLSIWYRFLNKKFETNTTTIPTTLVKKILIDQLIFYPSLVLGILTSVQAVQRKSPKEIKLYLRKNYFDILKKGYCVWPIVAILNFRFIPVQYHVLLNNVVAVFWNTYFTWRIQHTDV